MLGCLYCPEYLFNIVEVKKMSSGFFSGYIMCSTICSYSKNDGTIPALLDRIINRCLFRLVKDWFPWYCNRAALDEHGHMETDPPTQNTLPDCSKDGLCRFEDNGWRLSSTATILVKQNLSLQFVAEKILGFDTDTSADSAHLNVTGPT
jgi:hypothetical protein